MKGYYITYGIFTEDLDNIVKDLEHYLEINLLKDGYKEDYEIYYLKSSQNKIITHFSIHDSSPEGYHYSESEIVYPNYLISCTLIFEDENEAILLRRKLSSKDYLKELNLDIDEW